MVKNDDGMFYKRFRWYISHMNPTAWPFIWAIVFIMAGSFFAVFEFLVWIGLIVLAFYVVYFALGIRYIWKKANPQ